MTCFPKHLGKILFVSSFCFFTIAINAIDETKRVLTVGCAICDVFIKGNKDDIGYMDLSIGRKDQGYLLIRDGVKVDIGDAKIYTGGGATNAAVSMQRQGCETYLYCRVGRDYWAKFIEKDMAADGVNTSCITYDNDASTGISFIIPTPHDRSLFVLRGANTKIKKEDFPFGVLDSVSGVYITSLSGSSVGILEPLAKKAHEKKVLVATNPGSAQLKSGPNCIAGALSMIDILIMNTTEAEILLNTLIKEKYLTLDDLSDLGQIKSGNKNSKLFDDTMFSIEDTEIGLPKLFKALMKLGPKILVVTNGKEGAYVGTSDAMYYCPIVSAKVVNTLGAGDAFGSTFVASIIQGKTIEQAMQTATVNAASVVSCEGAKTGLLKTDELQARVKASKLVVQKFIY